MLSEGPGTSRSRLCVLAELRGRTLAAAGAALHVARIIEVLAVSPEFTGGGVL